VFNSSSAEKLKDRAEYMHASVEALDNYYLLSAVLRNISLQYFQRVANQKGEPLVSENILLSFDPDKFNLSEIIQIYIYVFQFYNGNSSFDRKEIFYKVKELAKAAHDSFSKNDCFEVYKLMSNMVNQLFIEGNLEFKKELFDNHLFWIEKKAHIHKGGLFSHTYYAICVSACQVGETEWFRIFSEENKMLLSSLESKDVVMMSDAVVLFYEKKYSAAMEILLTINYLNISWSLAGKIWEIKCLYEQSEYDLLDSYLKNYENLIRRNKVLRVSIRTSVSFGINQS